MQNESERRELENKYHGYLSYFLKNKKFEEVIKLIEKSTDLDIFIDPRKIHNRIEIVSNLLIECIRNLNLGEIFNILRFVNKYDLVDKDLTDSELKIVETIKNDPLFITNLIDLFGNVSNSFILYVIKVMPSNLFSYYNNYFSEYSFYSNDGYDINLILNYLNEYNVYGLTVKLLGNLEDFISSFNKKYVKNDEKFIEFKFANKKHLVSAKNILKNMKRITSGELYNFYCLSMVILYGIGPQGFGFTFSTPKGEVIEICSDVKENEAIIIKYKEFLKEQFLLKLKQELIDLNIEYSIIDKLNAFLLEILKPKNLINYYKKDEILRKIKYFFDSNISISINKKEHFQKLINKISKIISKILRPIEMIDQFKARMDLLADGKLRSEDIAKLTSLKEKSHYDVLRERVFLQYIVDWFYKIYLEKEADVKD
ncbi:MAG: hypothetical protein ACXACC_04715 [Promethearchaeota archaeon]|jgi:hypothetical protein